MSGGALDIQCILNNGCQIIGAWILGSEGRSRIEERSKKELELSETWRGDYMADRHSALGLLVIPLDTRLKLSSHVEMTMTPKSR